MEKYIKRSEKWAFGFAGFGSYMVSNLVATYLLFFLTDILIVPTIFVTVLMFVARGWDVINDPLMGVFIDSRKVKKDKMRPFLRWGAIPLGLITILLFTPLSEAPAVFKMCYATVIYLLFGMAYTFVDIPAMGLMSISTKNPAERADILSFFCTVGAIGGIVPMLLLPIFTKVFSVRWGYFALAVAVAAMTSVAYLTLYKKSKERFILKSEKISARNMFKVVLKNKPMFITLISSVLAFGRYLMLLSAIYIATYVLKIGDLDSETILLLLYFVVGSGMFLGIVLTPKLYKKFGFKKVFITFGLLSFATLFAAYFTGYVNYFVTLPLMFFGGFGLGVYNVLPYPMVGDSLDYLEWKTGRRMEGICFSANSFVTKLNAAIAAVAVTVVLAVAGFVQPVVSGVPLPQVETTVNGIYALVTIIPAIGFLLSVIPMMFYRFHGAYKEQILNELNERRAIQAEIDASDLIPAELDEDDGIDLMLDDTSTQDKAESSCTDVTAEVLENASADGDEGNGE